MRIASTVSDSIVDGPGLRFTVFTQGCPHHCPGCHNPHTHPMDGGEEISVQALFARFLDNLLLDGLTLSGGEPFMQAGECAALARLVHQHGRSVWTYTGFLYEELIREADPDRLLLLRETDVLVDGPFLERQKSYDALFRGSTNQRLIDLNATRTAGKLILWTQPDPLSKFTVPEW